MINLSTILICMLAGYLLRVTGKWGEQGGKALSTFVIYVSFPALIIHHVPTALAESELSLKLLIPISMPWLLVALAFTFFGFLGRLAGWSPEKVGALVLTAGFANTSFVGFPVLEALLGPEAIKTGILISQAGSFLALSTVGLILASIYSKNGAQTDSLLSRLFRFPPFLALLFSIGVYLFKIDLPDSVDAVLLKLAAALIPLALASVGSQIRLNASLIRDYRAPLIAGLVFKLILAPILFGLLYVEILRDYSFSTQVTLLESAMAPMITGAIIAAQFELDDELAYLLVGIGIPISLATVPILYFSVKSLFL